MAQPTPKGLLKQLVENAEVVAFKEARGQVVISILGKTSEDVAKLFKANGRQLSLHMVIGAPRTKKKTP
ncbi:MAG TPA: hypothetical protein VIG74_02405 [Alphaproteobacteria bacterium]|jgi:hypothetical protein